jgi:hypothetical protein
VSIEDRPLKVALTSDEPVDLVKVLEVWAKSPHFSDLESCRCACGNPVTTVHMRRIAHLPEEIEMFCDNCSTVIFLPPPRIKL